MFIQILIALIISSHIDGFALDVSSRNSRLNPHGDSRIVGGVEAPPGSANHMVALLTGQVITTLMCGGSIITDRHILTAAHCITPAVVWGELLPSFRGIVGNYYWNTTSVLVPFTGFLVHESWDSWSIKDDIGILATAGIPLSDRVAVIPLNFNWVDGEVESSVTGWGTVGFLMDVPDRLRILYLPTLSGGECVRRVLELDDQGWWSPPVDPEKEICTYHSPGHGMCHGDSGSALVQEQTRSQIGIVSWGFPCAVGAPDIFVRVSTYRDWLITATINL